MKVNCNNFHALILIIGLILTIPGYTYSQNISFEAETGIFWFSQNDVRIPNEGGTKFDMTDITGRNAAPYYRFRLNIRLGDRHNIRALFAPLSKIGTGVFDEDLFFEDTLFHAGVPIDGIYQFNTYRLTYRYTFYDRNSWILGAGVVALIRDAKVELIQPGRSDANTDLGFVPLLHIYAERKLGNNFSIILDGESLAAKQGRATDASLAVAYRFSDRWSTFAGYRVLEGGADVDEVYNFSWTNFGVAGIKLDF